jgi:hypothetical protein
MFATGYVSGSRTVHLTETTLVNDALCGETGIDMLGEPELGVICDECEAAAIAAGGDPANWRRVDVVALPLRRAA